MPDNIAAVWYKVPIFLTFCGEQNFVGKFEKWVKLQYLTGAGKTGRLNRIIGGVTMTSFCKNHKNPKNRQVFCL